MAIRVVRLGSPRTRGEGLRLGTVRRPPRGVPKSQYASRDFYDVWLPDLAPTETLLKKGRLAEDERAWKAFTRGYLAEMKRPETVRLMLLAVRWLFGFVLAGTATAMTWQTLKIPNTQAATGLLYVAVIATFLGELVSLMLTSGATYPL